MKRFEKFDKGNIKDARKILDEALNSLKDIGLDFKIGNIQYDSDTFNTKITISISGADSEYTREFKKYHEMYGFKLDMLDKVFKMGSKSYKLIGLKPRARKNPVLVKNINDGKLYRMDINIALMGLSNAGVGGL